MERIRRLGGVRAIAQVSFFGGYFRDARNSLPALATGVEQLAAVYPELHITRDEIDAMKTVRTGVLVGRPLAERFGWKVGDKIPVGTTLWTNTEGSNHWIFDVVGIYEASTKYARTSLGSGFWINYDYWDEARVSDRHRVDQFIVQIEDPRHATAIAGAIDGLFARIHRMRRARRRRIRRFSRSSKSSRTSTSSRIRSWGR